MKLYYVPGTCSFAVLILCHELRLKYQLERVDYEKRTLSGGKDYRAINAKGQIPAISLKNGEVLTETSVILTYLATKAKASLLLPKVGTMGYFRQLEKMSFVATELHKNMGPLFNKNLNAEAKELIRTQRLKPKLDLLEVHFGNSKFYSGKTFGLADCHCFAVLGWIEEVGLQSSTWPNIARYMADMSKRRSVREAKAVEQRNP